MVQVELETHHEGLLLHTRLLEDCLKGGQGVLQHMLWTDVHLGHNKEHWHLQCQSYTHMLFAHSNNACRMGKVSWYAASKTGLIPTGQNYVLSLYLLAQQVLEQLC